MSFYNKQKLLTLMLLQMKTVQKLIPHGEIFQIIHMKY